MSTSTTARPRDRSRVGQHDSKARREARWRTHLHLTRIRQAARSWPGWGSLPPSRRQVFDALLAEAESRGWREFDCSERYLVTVVIRHRPTGPAECADRRPGPVSAATCHRALADLRDAGWITLAREGCKVARRPRRWRIAQPPLSQAGDTAISQPRPPGTPVPPANAFHEQVSPPEPPPARGIGPAPGAAVALPEAAEVRVVITPPGPGPPPLPPRPGAMTARHWSRRKEVQEPSTGAAVGRVITRIGPVAWPVLHGRRGQPPSSLAGDAAGPRVGDAPLGGAS